MSFEVYTPRPGNRIPEGFVSIDRRCLVTIRKDDLAKIGIADEVTVMLCNSTYRIAFRKPKPGDPSVKVRHKKETNGGVFVAIGGPVKKMKLDQRKITGWYELMHKDDFLIFQLKQD